MRIEYDKLQKELHTRMIKRGFDHPRIIHSVFECEDYKEPWTVEAPQFKEVAINGEGIQFTTYDGGVSRSFDNPTWEDVMVAAQELIFANDLHDHIFVEGFYETGNPQVYTIALGS
jgi:hypothetical protein